ncbi:hypothetical protein [Nonomuraea sp. NPDC049400]|uniref:hypothetical protein n=1 Tax=Nonomuraea sp. NPDC049400 TaxID=3364352 RepID=UPI00378E5424
MIEIEIDQPDRKSRRFQGKSDPIDAIAAAKTAPAGDRTDRRHRRQDGAGRDRTVMPKRRDGGIEALRNLRVARRSAIDQRADVQRQIKPSSSPRLMNCASACAACRSRN